MSSKQEDKKSSDYLYLQKLKFNPELKKSWLNFFVSKFRVVILLILLVSVWGIYSYNKLPLESNPEVKIPVAIVTTVFPGASPEDVEELITKRIETGISGVEGIDKITSSSSNSFSAVSVEFNAGESLENSIRNLKDKVDSIKNELPEDAKEPQVQEISFDDTPILSLSLVGPYDGFTMRKYADDIQSELEKIPGARQVNVSGGDEKEFSVAYDPGKLIFYEISPDQANNAISATNIAIPSGNFEGDKFNYSVRSDARFFDAKKLGNVPIIHTEEGAIVYLRDIADVFEKAIKKTTYSRLSSSGRPPQNSVNIDIVKKTGGSIVKTSDEAKKTVEKMIATFPKGISYEITSDFSKIIREDFNQLSHDFLLTLALVSVILLLMVGLKEAFVAGLAIPLVFFVTFGLMLFTGITLNFLSIFSLLLSLGLLVDDAIVVVSATKQYLRTGKFTPEEAVLLVLNDFKWVLTTTTLTTIWAFLPLLLSTGIIGEFIKSIPIVVSVTLAASLMVALMINHPLAAVLERVRLKRTFFFQLVVLALAGIGLLIYQKTILNFIFAGFGIIVLSIIFKWYLKRGRKLMIANEKLVKEEWESSELIKKKLLSYKEKETGSISDRLLHGVIHLDRILPTYEKHLKAILANKKRRYAVLGSALILFVAASLLPITGIVPTEFFPASDEETLFINIEAPTGLNLDETNRITEEVENRLLKYSEISNFSTVVGKPGISFQSVGPNIQNPSNMGGIVATLVDKKNRGITSYNLAENIRKDLADIKNAKISVESARGGPPSGAAFEARITGDDLQILDKIAHDLEPMLSEISGVADVSISLKNAPAEYTFSLDPARMELYGTNAAAVSSALRIAISGMEVGTVFLENKEINIMATFSEDKIKSLEELQNIQILNLQKQPVFLKDLAKVELNPSVESITRIDQKRTVLLSSGVQGKTRPNEVLAEFQKKTAGYQMPNGYEIVYGGENEQNTESVYSILQAMVIAAVLIVSTLIIQFNSFKKALIVLATFPLALIGVFFGLGIFGIALSFPGLIGILALFGIVVKNAIILIDKINLNLQSKIPFKEAIVDAGKSRFEAIFITSICTIFGIIPVTLSNELWKALGGAIIFGLSLSSFLTLVIVPVLFATLISEDERF